MFTIAAARHRRDARKWTPGPHRNVSRGRGASGGSFASDSRWPENFSRSPLAMRWRRRASRRFWPASCRALIDGTRRISYRTTHTPSTRLAGRWGRAVVEFRVARHSFGILAEPRLEGALARRLLLPRLGLARAPRRVPPLASYKFLEVDRGAADGLLLRFRRWWRRWRLRGEALRHFDGRPGPGLLHVRGDALDLRVASMSFGPLAGERSPAVRHVDGRRQCWSRVDGVQPWIRASFTPSTRRSKKDAVSRT